MTVYHCKKMEVRVMSPNKARMKCQPIYSQNLSARNRQELMRDVEWLVGTSYWHECTTFNQQVKVAVGIYL